MATFRRSSVFGDERLTRLRPAVGGTLVAMAALVVGSAATPARASLFMQITNSSVAPGGTGSFDVNLVDNGGTFQVSGFEVEISVPGASGISFTGANGNTSAPYIFGTATTPLSSNTFPNTDFIALDASQTPPFFVTLNNGNTVGLEHVTYSAAAGKPTGPVTVSVVSGNNTLVDDVNGNPITLGAPVSGTISPQASPEPSTLLMAGGVAAGALGVHYRRRRRGS